MLSQDQQGISPMTQPEARKAKKTILLTFFSTLTVFSFWLGGIFLAPYLRSISSPWASLVYSVYSPFCHQVWDRSMTCFGHQMSVCARCLGIYSGILLGLILYPFFRGWRQVRVPRKGLFFFFSAPIVLDTAANFIGLWKSPHAVRLVTGILWGVLLPCYLITGIVDFLRMRQKRRSDRDKNTA